MTKNLSSVISQSVRSVMATLGMKIFPVPAIVKWYFTRIQFIMFRSFILIELAKCRKRDSLEVRWNSSSLPSTPPTSTYWTLSSDDNRLCGMTGNPAFLPWNEETISYSNLSSGPTDLQVFEFLYPWLQQGWSALTTTSNRAIDEIHDFSAVNQEFVFGIDVLDVLIE